MTFNLPFFHSRLFLFVMLLSLAAVAFQLRQFFGHFPSFLAQPLLHAAADESANPNADAQTADTPPQKETEDKKESGAAEKEIDLLNMTFEEVQMLTTLAAQHNNSFLQKNSFKKQEESLTILKNEIQSRLEDLEKVEKRLRFLAKESDKKEQAHMREIVKVFESMKPQEAAPIFSRLEPRVLLMILQRMKGVKIAAILAQLPPDQAAKITVVMTDIAQGVGIS